ELPEIDRVREIAVDGREDREVLRSDEELVRAVALLRFEGERNEVARGFLRVRRRRNRDWLEGHPRGAGENPHSHEVVVVDAGELEIALEDRLLRKILRREAAD